MSRLCSCCSMKCADQPVTRAITKIGVYSGTSRPSAWYSRADGQSIAVLRSAVAEAVGDLDRQDAVGLRLELDRAIGRPRGDPERIDRPRLVGSDGLGIVVEAHHPGGAVRVGGAQRGRHPGGPGEQRAPELLAAQTTAHARMRSVAVTITRLAAQAGPPTPAWLFLISADKAWSHRVAQPVFLLC